MNNFQKDDCVFIIDEFTNSHERPDLKSHITYVVEEVRENGDCVIALPLPCQGQRRLKHSSELTKSVYTLDEIKKLFVE